jgi:phosphate transport system protein
MVKDAIDSFINSNTELAQKVLDSDETVDKMNKENFKFLVSKMQTDQAMVEPCSHLILLTRQIERMADHATNIAENLVFYVDAEFISHQKKLRKKSDDVN